MSALVYAVIALWVCGILATILIDLARLVLSIILVILVTVLEGIAYGIEGFFALCRIAFEKD
jgi:hypothetical protein